MEKQLTLVSTPSWAGDNKMAAGIYGTLTQGANPRLRESNCIPTPGCQGLLMDNS